MKKITTYLNTPGVIAALLSLTLAGLVAAVASLFYYLFKTII